MGKVSLFLFPLFGGFIVGLSGDVENIMTMKKKVNRESRVSNLNYFEAIFFSTTDKFIPEAKRVRTFFSSSPLLCYCYLLRFVCFVVWLRCFSFFFLNCPFFVFSLFFAFVASHWNSRRIFFYQIRRSFSNRVGMLFSIWS